jgi:A/G-specific adenine glycosylase
LGRRRRRVSGAAAGRKHWFIVEQGEATIEKELERGAVKPNNEETRRFRLGVLDWFRENSRDFHWRAGHACTYTKVVSEVLLQRTQAPVVSEFLPTFLSAFPNWEAIAASEEENLGSVLRPLGLWRRRAKSLKALSAEISRRDGSWPATRLELEEMPAVGQYVASAVMMFEHGTPAPLMDASMARVLRRYFTITPKKADIRYDKPLQEIAHAVVDDPEAVRVNWAILDFAALQCKRVRPECESCPLRSDCGYFASLVE